MLQQEFAVRISFDFSVLFLKDIVAITNFNPASLETHGLYSEVNGRRRWWQALCTSNDFPPAPSLKAKTTGNRAQMVSDVTLPTFTGPTARLAAATHAETNGCGRKKWNTASEREKSEMKIKSDRRTDGQTGTRRCRAKMQ